MQLLLLSVGLVVAISGLGQQVNRDPSLLVTGSGFLNTRTIAPELEGKTVLFDEFKNSAVYITSNDKTTSANALLNYDIYLNRMVVNYLGQLFEMDAVKVDSVKFEVKKDSILIAINVKYLEGLDKKGFGYQLFKGENIELIKQIDIEVIKPTYNELMNVGSRNYIVKMSDKYYIKKSEEKRYSKFTPRKSSFSDLDVSGLNTEFIKKSDLKNEQNIIKLFKAIDQSIVAR